MVECWVVLKRRERWVLLQTAQAGVDTSSGNEVQNVMQDLTKDYRGVMNELKKKDGQIIMAVIENDLNEDTYIGLELPMTHTQNGFFNRTKTLEQS